MDKEGEWDETSLILAATFERFDVVKYLCEVQNVKVTPDDKSELKEMIKECLKGKMIYKQELYDC